MSTLHQPSLRFHSQSVLRNSLRPTSPRPFKNTTNSNTVRNGQFSSVTKSTPQNSRLPSKSNV